MNTSAHGCSDIGRVRSSNQDRFLVDEELGLYIVADGMGGAAGGEVAAAIGVETVRDLLELRSCEIAEVAEGVRSPQQLRVWLRDAVVLASREVANRAAEELDLAGMGSTLTALLVVGDVAIVAHVGDSRAYLLRAGDLRQLTCDHTVAEEMVRCGLIQREEVELVPYRHVLTRCLGRYDVRVDSHIVDLHAGDRFLLCSDGLSGHLDEALLTRVLIAEEAPATMAGQLVRDANRAGGRDNVTAVVVEVVAAMRKARHSGDGDGENDPRRRVTRPDHRALSGTSLVA